MVRSSTPPFSGSAATTSPTTSPSVCVRPSRRLSASKRNSASRPRASCARTTSSRCRAWVGGVPARFPERSDRKSTRLHSSHVRISYAVFCLKKKRKHTKATSKETDKKEKRESQKRNKKT